MPATTELRPAFRRRFRTVARQIWSLHVGRGIALTVAVAAALLAAAATADYFFELPWVGRAAVLTACTAVVAVLGTRWIVRPALAWSKTRVAAELEGLFPRLGQRLRTAAQHGDRPAEDLARDGVAPGLVAALEQETAERAKPLPFQAALPVRPALAAAVTAVCCLVAVAAVAVWDPEWQTALGRAGLAPTPYTNLAVTPSADAVLEGADVDVRATMSGRARPEVMLHVREVGEQDWRQETMEAEDGAYTARLSRLRGAIEFFVTAGPERTPVRQVVVRHPLKVVEMRAEVTSPAYTGVAPITHDTGSFSALQGSTARIHVELDRAPVSAALLVKDLARSADPPRRIDMTVRDRTAVAELPLAADIEYTVEARDSEDMAVAANRHRVRVTTDQPPTVSFVEPNENLEVHTLAEVLMRVSARDDFGVTRVGIVFQVNNEEERTLVLNDITEPFQREVRAEQLMMLEQFLLTQKDCVAYYAFAEDNRPGGPHRTATDLRFIDIRPFRRTYQLIDPPEAMGGGPQRELVFLDEVIARQRFNLNQTIRLETRSKVRIDLAQVEKIAVFENKLATQTHDLADFLSNLGVDGAAILIQAEEAMLSAVDSLNNAKFGTAVGQERDALRYLMEARNTIQQAIVKKPRPVRAQARAFDRLQRQKLRRHDERAETLPQVAEELGKLADEEDDVARAIAGPGSKPGDKPMPGGDGAKAEPKNGKGGEDPAQERQDDIAGRAAALEKVAATAKGLTGLAKTRITDAAKAANAAADALGQSDRPNARREVDRARELFRVASKQVAALAAEEVAQQLAAARDIANDIAMQTAPPEPMKNPGAGGSRDGKTPGLGSAAEQARTLKDVLEQLAGSGAEENADAARKAGGILKQEDLTAAIDRLEKPGVGGDRGERQDLAARFGGLGQRLDQAYRETVAPRLEAIGRLEREANELAQRAGAAEDAAEWRRLRQQGAEFVEHLELAGLGGLANEDIQAALRTGGGGRDTFARGVALAHARLLAKLQDFVAGDRFNTANEAVPPEYKDLVDRYLRALSAGSAK